MQLRLTNQHINNCDPAARQQLNHVSVRGAEPANKLKCYKMCSRQH
jgi:hypothetical protein